MRALRAATSPTIGPVDRARIGTAVERQRGPRALSPIMVVGVAAKSLRAAGGLKRLHSRQGRRLVEMRSSL